MEIPPALELAPGIGLDRATGFLPWQLGVAIDPAYDRERGWGDGDRGLDKDAAFPSFTRKKDEEAVTIEKGFVTR